MPNFLSFLVEAALRSSFILAAAFILLGLMKQASASERHLVILFSLLVTAFVPVGLLLSPRMSWTIPLPWQMETGVSTQKIITYWDNENTLPLPATLSPGTKHQPSVLEALTLTNGLVAFMAGGMLVQVVLLGRAARSWQKIRRQAVPTHLPDEALDRVRNFAGPAEFPPIYASDAVSVPLLAGWLRPAIILPVEARVWPPDRLSMVLCHEIAHFRRGDSLLLPLLCALRILYWWHPLVWLALARLLRERENACDDLVLNHHFRATDYADLIVSTARQARMQPWPNGALAMASPSPVGERIRAILNPALNRRQAGRTATFTGLILAFALGWFFVAVQVQAEEKPATFSSTAASDASKQPIKLEFKLISIDDKTYLDKRPQIEAALARADLPFFVQLPGTSVLSSPSVITPNGSKAAIKMGQDLPYPARLYKAVPGGSSSEPGTRAVGVSIEVVPTLQPDKQSVMLQLNCELTHSGGWKDLPSGGREPVLETRSISSKNVVTRQGLVLLVGSDTTPGQAPAPSGNNRPPGDASPRQILLFINARPVSKKTAALPPPPPPGTIPTKKILVQAQDGAASQSPYRKARAVSTGTTTLALNSGATNAYTSAMIIKDPSSSTPALPLSGTGTTTLIRTGTTTYTGTTTFYLVPQQPGTATLTLTGIIKNKPSATLPAHSSTITPRSK